jgi:hypothetical protein
MAASAFTTESAPQMIRGGENHQAGFKIKIAGQNFSSLGLQRFALKSKNAGATNAGFIFQIGRNLVKERTGNIRPRTPARPFVGRAGAELAIV